MNETVLTHENNGVLTLTINRPERRNALDVATYLALADHIRAASTSKDYRAIVITGASNYFTAGNDLKDFQKPRTSGDSGGIILLRSNQSEARRAPTICASNTLEAPSGQSPSATNGIVNSAMSAAQIKSQCCSIVTPMPIARPSTAAMIGKSQSIKLRNKIMPPLSPEVRGF